MNAATHQLVDCAFQDWSSASRALADANAAYRAEQRTRDYARWHQLRAAQRAAQERHDAANAALEAARAVARAQFAAARGWEFGMTRKDRPLRTWSRGCLGRVLDHEEFLRNPIGVITHTYESLQNVRQFAEENDLNAEVLDWSWYFPGGTTAVLFTARAAP